MTHVQAIYFHRLYTSQNDLQKKVKALIQNVYSKYLGREMVTEHGREATSKVEISINRQAQNVFASLSPQNEN